MTTGKKKRIDFVIGHFVVVTMPAQSLVCNFLFGEFIIKFVPKFVFLTVAKLLKCVAVEPRMAIF